MDVYPELKIRAVSMDVPLPSVIALTDYIKQPNQNPAFTRRNVYLRDGYICQYCGNRFKTPDLTLDHVYPRCYGGKLEWCVYTIQIFNEKTFTLYPLCAHTIYFWKKEQCRHLLQEMQCSKRINVTHRVT